MTDITKIDHAGPVTTCGAGELQQMTQSGWCVLAVTKMLVPRHYTGSKYNQNTCTHEDTYDEARDTLVFVLGKSKDDALEEAWAAKRFAEVERDQALDQVTRTLEELVMTNDALVQQRKQIEKVVDERNDMRTTLENAYRERQRGEQALADLRRDFVKVKTAIGELRVKEILG